MEYSREFLSKVYGAYLDTDCMLLYKVDFEQGRRFPEYGRIVKAGKVIDEIEFIDGSNTDRIVCKMLLNRKDSISDEYAIDLCKIVHAGELLNDEWDLSVGGREGDVIRIERWLLEDGQRYPLTDLILNLSNPEYKDYLRGYNLDCGFAHLHSLIDSGFATDKSTI